MRTRFRMPSAMTLLSLLAAASSPTLDDEPANKAVGQTAPPAPKAQKAILRGLAFLQADVAKWRKERTCATCHHGTMTVWALTEAKSQGFPVDPETLSDVTLWTKQRLESIDQPRDTRPGWSMVSTPAVFLALMSLAVPTQDAISRAELGRIAGHLLRHQEADGSWAWSSAPPKNRPPPVFESDEVVTLMAFLALGPHVPADTGEPAPARAASAHAAVWLEQHKPGESTQARALQLFRDIRAGKPARELERAIARVLVMQHGDSGWGQERDLPSDAFATGQALYFLSLAGVSSDRAEIQRAVTLLTSSQKPDGSWPMTSRAHPGATPMTNPVPITYFGSAWATLGLLRSFPKETVPTDPAARGLTPEPAIERTR
jgi:hypothetical protein